MFAIQKLIHYTIEEYLNREFYAEYKNEFHDGHIYAMSGASREHNLIVFNLGRELGIQLKQRPCETYIGDMRVKEKKRKTIKPRPF